MALMIAISAIATSEAVRADRFKPQLRPDIESRDSLGIEITILLPFLGQTHPIHDYKRLPAEPHGRTSARETSSNVIESHNLGLMSPFDALWLKRRDEKTVANYLASY
jgi:hypothetical protein